MVLVGKEELFEWVHQVSGLPMTSWRDVVDGTIILRLMKEIWGSQMDLDAYEIAWEPNQASDIEKNWVVILTFFNRFGIPNVIDIAAVVIGNTMAIYNLLVMLFFLYNLSQSTSFELAFKIQVDEKVAAFLQSPHSLEVLGLNTGEMEEENDEEKRQNEKEEKQEDFIENKQEKRDIVRTDNMGGNDNVLNNSDLSYENESLKEQEVEDLPAAPHKQTTLKEIEMGDERKLNRKDVQSEPRNLDKFEEYIESGNLGTVPFSEQNKSQILALQKHQKHKHGLQSSRKENTVKKSPSKEERKEEQDQEHIKRTPSVQKTSNNITPRREENRGNKKNDRDDTESSGFDDLHSLNEGICDHEPEINEKPKNTDNKTPETQKDISGYVKTIDHLKKIIANSAKTMELSLNMQKSLSKNSNSLCSPIEEVQRGVISELEKTISHMGSMWTDCDLLTNFDQSSATVIAEFQKALAKKMKSVNEAISELTDKLVSYDQYVDEYKEKDNRTLKTNKVIKCSEKCRTEIEKLKKDLIQVITSGDDIKSMSDTDVGTLLDYSIIKGECNDLKSKISTLENLLIFGSINSSSSSGGGDDGQSFLWAWSDLVETLNSGNGNDMGYGGYEIEGATKATKTTRKSKRLQALEEADERALELGDRLASVCEDENSTLPIAVPKWLVDINKIDASSVLLDAPEGETLSKTRVVDSFIDAVQRMFETCMPSGNNSNSNNTKASRQDAVLNLGFESIDRFIEELTSSSTKADAEDKLKTFNGLNKYIVELISNDKKPIASGDNFIFNAKCMQAIEALGEAIKESNNNTNNNNSEGASVEDKLKSKSISHVKKHTRSLRLFAYIVLRLILRDDIWRRRLTHCRAILMMLIGRTEGAHAEIMRLKRAQIEQQQQDKTSTSTSSETLSRKSSLGISSASVLSDPNSDPARLSARLSLLSRELSELQADMEERDTENVSDIKKLFGESNKLRTELKREKKLRRELEAIAETKEELYRAIVEEQRAYIEITENILEGTSVEDRREEIDARVRDCVKRLNEVMMVEEEKNASLSRSKGQKVSSSSDGDDNSEKAEGLESDVTSDICLYYKSKNRKLKEELRQMKQKVDQSNGVMKEKEEDITRLRALLKKQIDANKELKRTHLEEKDRLERELSRILTGKQNEEEMNAEEILKNILCDKLQDEDEDEDEE